MVHIETVEDQGIQCTSVVLGQRLDSPNAEATITLTKDHIAVMLEYIAHEVRHGIDMDRND